MRIKFLFSELFAPLRENMCGLGNPHRSIISYGRFLACNSIFIVIRTLMNRIFLNLVRMVSDRTPPLFFKKHR
jgi:hypothetical protein